MFAIERHKAVLPATTQVLAIGAAAVTSTALAADTGYSNPLVFIRLATTGNVFVHISAAGTAATSANGFVLPAGAVEFLRISRGDRVSIIETASADEGFVSVSVVEA